MMIDKVGGLGPNYGQGAPKELSTSQSFNAKDRVSISEEASRAAELARIADLAKNSEAPERLEKLELVRERLAKGEYEELNKEQTGKIADSLMQSFFS